MSNTRGGAASVEPTGLKQVCTAHLPKEDVDRVTEQDFTDAIVLTTQRSSAKTR